MNSELHNRIFFEIHSGNPREAPGSPESSQLALSMLLPLSADSWVLDIGCGPGQQTLDLAAHCQAAIIAIDNHRGFLQELSGRLVQKSYAGRVFPVQCEMDRLAFQTECFDLIWSEGAIYIMGFERGLRNWRRYLKPGGFMALTELTWLKPGPPSALQEFWRDGYPDMNSIVGNVAIIGAAGYRVIDTFVLPEKAWWDYYYTPIETKLAILRKKYRDHPDALEIIRLEETEISMYRNYSEYYGYVFYIIQKT